MKNLTVKEVNDICSKHKYLILRYSNGQGFAVNGKISNISIKKKNIPLNKVTGIIGFCPCNFMEYISTKTGFL